MEVIAIMLLDQMPTAGSIGKAENPAVALILPQSFHGFFRHSSKKLQDGFLGAGTHYHGLNVYNVAKRCKDRVTKIMYFYFICNFHSC